MSLESIFFILLILFLVWIVKPFKNIYSPLSIWFWINKKLMYELMDEFCFKYTKILSLKLIFNNIIFKILNKKL